MKTCISREHIINVNLKQYVNEPLTLKGLKYLDKTKIINTRCILRDQLYKYFNHFQFLMRVNGDLLTIFVLNLINSLDFFYALTVTLIVSNFQPLQLNVNTTKTPRNFCYIKTKVHLNYFVLTILFCTAK